MTTTMPAPLARTKPKAGTKSGKKSAKKSGKKSGKKVSYAPGKFTQSPVLSGHDHTVASRFSYGITPALAREVTAAGGGLAWFEQQIAHAYDGQENVAANWWPELSADPTSDLMRNLDGDGFSMMYPSWLLVRRISSPRQVLERITEFWENHLHVPARPDAQFRYRADYGRMIRSKALGKFSDLLIATTEHPAMQLYLGGAGSTVAHPNENLGREVLELHTVGVGNYTEDDVKNAARVLTGFVVDASARQTPTYSPVAHWLGPVTVMSTRSGWPTPFTAANSSVDGRQTLRNMLVYLAKHPATAQRLAYKMATAFVSDAPSPDLVAEMAAAYTANDTAIVPMLRTMLNSPHFAASAGAKLRDPAADLVATHRAIGSAFQAPTSWGSAANQIFWQLNSIGAAPMWWPTPDGPPQVAGPWATSVRAMTSADIHYSAAGGWYPAAEITYPRTTSFMPRPKMKFRDWVDHLSRVVLGQPATAELVHACCETTGLDPKGVVKRSSEWAHGRFPDLLTTLLDTPAHYYH